MMRPMQIQAITLYGISNCDTVKRARAWLTSQGLTHQNKKFKRDRDLCFKVVKVRPSQSIQPATKE